MAEIADHAARAEPFATDLELRLHHRHQVRPGRGAGGEGRQHQGERDERKVGDDQLDEAADGIRRQGADVGAVVQLHPVIGLQAPDQLPVADVDGDHLTGAAPEQHIGETTGRRTGVQASSTFDHDVGKSVESADKFVRTPGRPVLVGDVLA